MSYLLYLRDPARNVGGPVISGQLEHLPSGDLGAKAEARLAEHQEVAFLTHGFNVSRDDGIKYLEAFTTYLTDVGDTALVAVLWPGDSWAGSNAYAFEGRQADDSGAALVKFISGTLPGDTLLHFAAHSLGNRVILEAIQRLVKSPYRVDQVCLMAAAVNDFVFADNERYELAVRSCNRVGVLSSGEDKVLKYAYPAGNLLEAFLFWKREVGFALGLDGPKHPVSQSVKNTHIPNERDAQHGDYLPDFKNGAAVPPGQSAQNQLSASAYANQVLSGTDRLIYR